MNRRSAAARRRAGGALKKLAAVEVIGLHSLLRGSRVQRAIASCARIVTRSLIRQASPSIRSLSERGECPTLPGMGVRLICGLGPTQPASKGQGGSRTLQYLALSLK